MSKQVTALTQRSTFAHWACEHVRFSDTDMLGHVNNGALTTYCETGRTQCVLRYLMQDGIEGKVFVMARLEIDFRQELHWPAQVDIGTGILTIGRSSFQVGQGLFVADACVASAISTLVVIDSAARRPLPIDDALRARMSELLIAL